MLSVYFIIYRLIGFHKLQSTIFSYIITVNAAIHRTFAAAEFGVCGSSFMTNESLWDE